MFVPCVSVHSASACCSPAQTQATSYSEACGTAATDKQSCLRVGPVYSRARISANEQSHRATLDTRSTTFTNKGLDDGDATTVDDILGDGGLKTQNNYVQVSGMARLMKIMRY